MIKIHETLLEIGYDGYICLEALPLPDGLSCAKRGIEIYKELPT